MEKPPSAAPAVGRIPVVTLCREHSKQPGDYANSPPSTFVGKFVQLQFTKEGGPSENLWVEVERLDDKGKDLVGRLDNHPRVLTSWKRGDKLAFTVGEILRVLG